MPVSVMQTYNQAFRMTNNINKFIANASVAKTSIAVSFSNAVIAQLREGIGNKVNILA